MTAILISSLAVILGIRYVLFMNQAKKRLQSYDSLVKTMETSHGKVSYIEEGAGETILISHGIFGGYDQGYSCFKAMTDQYRILAPSRFGYPGTDLPENASVKNQAEQYVEVLDKLGIEKVYILGTSAGGACAIRFAMEYPERVKGLILYCSGGIPKDKPQEEKIPSYNAVPSFLCNNITLWIAGPVFKKVMNCSAEDWIGVFPTNRRKDGVINDGYQANRELLINYDEYELEKFKVPVIAFHAKDDKFATYEDVADTIRRIPDGTLVSFEKGGHMMTGNGKIVNEQLERFIKRTK